MKLTKQGVRDLNHLPSPKAKRVELPPDRPDTRPEPCAHCGSRLGTYIDEQDYLLIRVCRGCNRDYVSADYSS